MNNTLLPCPFCWKQIAEIGNCKNMEECEHFEECPAVEPYVCVVCSINKGGCGASTGYQDGVEKAIAAWNRRVDARQLALKTRVCPMCEDCPDGCPVETPKDSRNIVTNADRIRSMSDEELAEWLVDANMCERVCIEEDYCGCDVCVNRVTDWLKQPLKEE